MQARMLNRACATSCRPQRNGFRTRSLVRSYVGVVVSASILDANTAGEPGSPPPTTAATTMPSTKWYLSPQYMEDPEHAAAIGRARERAAGLDDSGIGRLVSSVVGPQRTSDDHWTLIILEARAVPAMVRALSDPAATELNADRRAARLERLWEYLEPHAPESAVAPLEKLTAHAE